MGSIYTDEAREERYAKLRIKKKRCETVFDGCMWAVVLLGFLGLFVQVRTNAGFVGEILGAILTILCYAGVIYALYMKKLKVTIGVIAAIALLTAIGTMGAGLAIPLLAVTIPFTVTWEKLEQEEGFPLFQVTYHERNAERQLIESRIEHRAAELGVRAVSNSDPVSGMHDLLDAGNDLQALPSKLHGYHTRAQSAQPQVTAKQLHSDRMDSLEEIGAPPASPRIDLRKDGD